MTTACNLPYLQRLEDDGETSLSRGLWFGFHTRRFYDSAPQACQRTGCGPHRSIQRHRLATARALTSRGAKFVLASRNETALQEIDRECKAQGGRAIAVEPTSAVLRSWSESLTWRPGSSAASMPGSTMQAWRSSEPLSRARSKTTDGCSTRTTLERIR